jgi:hypothetical protein
MVGVRQIAVRKMIKKMLFRRIYLIEYFDIIEDGSNMIDVLGNISVDIAG